MEIKDQQTGETEKIPLLRYYSIFNVTQCSGLTAHIPTASESKRDFSPIEAAERIVQGMPKRPAIRHGYSQAYYSPSEDYIALPSPDQFKTKEDYASVRFHELVHSTAHETRLNRKGVKGSEGNWSAFGSNPYAKEELVAEMGAAFLCGEVGITETTIQNSAAYISSWLQRLRNDNTLVVRSAAAAQKAADYILGKWHGETLEESEPTSQN